MNTPPPHLTVYLKSLDDRFFNITLRIREASTGSRHGVRM